MKTKFMLSSLLRNISPALIFRSKWLFKAKALCLSSCLLLGNIYLQGQNSNYQLDEVDETLFVGGLSATILDRGQVEVNMYTSLYSVWLAIHESVIESPVIDRLRLSEFTTNAEVYYGFSDSGRWDLGARVRYAKRRLANAAQSSPFKVFSNSESESENVGFDKSYGGLREIGIRFRLMPFENVPELTLNAGYSFAPKKSDEVAEYLLADRNNFDVSISYFVSLNENNTSFYYFILNGTAFQPGSLEINQQWLYNSSASFFIVQRFGKLMFYPGLSYTLTYKPPSRENNTQMLVKTNEQLLANLGLQYQIGESVSLNVSTAIPLILETTNLLIDQVRSSFSFVSLGGRVTF